MIDGAFNKLFYFIKQLLLQ